MDNSGNYFVSVLPSWVRLGFGSDNPVIAGYNTDIEHNGTVYHIQTEDKGAPAHMIMSLVYDGGTILASKRVKYDDLAVRNFDEKEIAERVSRQHKLMCAAVKTGRIQELKEMTGRERTNGARQKKDPQGTSDAQSKRPEPSTSRMGVDVRGAEPTPAVSRSALKFDFVDLSPDQVPFSDSLPDDLMIDGIEIIDEAELLPDDAVTVISEFAGRERKPNNKLSLVLTDETIFRGGDRKTITIMVCRGTGGNIVPKAQILVKVLGSGFRPVIFHANSDVNGLAKVHLQIPRFKAGRAALMIRAMADGDQVELRRIVRPG